MSYHLKFRFMLAVVMGIGFAAMTPLMSHALAQQRSHAQVAIGTNVVEFKTSEFDRIVNSVMIAADTIVARSR
jgi:hypothetical protein